MNSKEIFGAEVQYWRLEPRYWETVVQRFADSGLRCVTAYVPWEVHCIAPPDRKNPAGVLDFDGKSDPQLNVRRFVEIIEKHGLNMNFRAGPFCCNEMTFGGHPGWLVLGDPDMMVWDFQNRPAQGYWIGGREGSQPSYLHPEYLRLVGAWMNAVDKIIVPHTAANGGCITMINLDNEISYVVRDSFNGSDYNPVNVGKGGFYHKFLRSKYGSAAKLPYGVKYAAFADVPAPRRVPAEVGADLAYYTDWCEFKTWVMCEYIRRLRKMHDDNGVRGVTYMTNFNPHRPEGLPTRMPDFEKATGGVAGYDFYRGTFMSYSGYHSMARILKLMNASVSYTWSAEFMSGTWNKVLPTRVSDDHMRFMARCALSQGCKSIAWFMFHDRLCWGDAPLSSHGHVRSQLNVLAEIPDILFNKIRHWDALVPQMDAAVIYDVLQHTHTYLGDPMPCADNDMHVGGPAIAGVKAGQASLEYEGLYRLVEEAGFQAGAVDIMHSAAPLAAYKLAFLPGSAVLEAAASAALKKWVAKGNTLVLSGAWPAINEAGRKLAFLGLPTPRKAAGVRTFNVGKGKLVWHADWLVQDEVEKEPLDSIKFVAGLLARHADAAHVKIEPDGLVIWIDWGKNGATEYPQPRNFGSAVLHSANGENILFVLNHYPEAARFNLTFKDKFSRLTNLSTGEASDIRHGKVTLDIDRKACEIYRVE